MTPEPADRAWFDGLLRPLVPQVTGALLRRYRSFDFVEDAVQEALLAAVTQWPGDGVPDNPRGWLITVASRRLADRWRSETARHRRESVAAGQVTGRPATQPPADEPGDPADDTLTLLFLCCHEELSPHSQIALTLRAVAGLSTAQIARAFLVPEATMTRRISRAKQRLAAADAPFAPPPPTHWARRLGAVEHTLYLMFNEGYTATAGPALHRSELTGEAIRLTRQVHDILPDDGEVSGLLALMLLTDARRPARSTPDGALVPLAEQDRSRWDAAEIAEGIDLVSRTLPRGPVGPYQVQAAIAAVHAEARQAGDTDWPQIAALYQLLERLSPGPMVRLSRAVAVAMTDGPQAGFELLAEPGDDRLGEHHRLQAVLAYLHEMAGHRQAARTHYEQAAAMTMSLPERRYLLARAARLE